MSDLLNVVLGVLLSSVLKPSIEEFINEIKERNENTLKAKELIKRSLNEWNSMSSDLSNSDKYLAAQLYGEIKYVLLEAEYSKNKINIKFISKLREFVDLVDKEISDMKEQSNGIDDEYDYYFSAVVSDKECSEFVNLAKRLYSNL